MTNSTAIKYGGMSYAEFYFGNVGRSMVTFSSLLTLADWGAIVTPVFRDKPVFVLFFVCYTMTTTVRTASKVQDERRRTRHDYENEQNIEKFQHLVHRKMMQHVQKTKQILSSWR